MWRIALFAAFMLPGHSVAAEQADRQISVQALFGDKVMLLINGQRHTLAVGQPAVEGVRAIDVNPHRAILEVGGRRYTYEPGAAVSLNFNRPQQRVETLYADRMGMFRRTGSINGRTVEFMVDTGATMVAMNRQQASRLGIDYRRGRAGAVNTASGVVHAYHVKLKSISLGAIKRQHVDALVIDGDHPGPILLGMSFLDALKVEKTGDSLTLKQR